MNLPFKMTLSGIVAALLVDAKEFYDYRKRNPGTAYDWQVAGVRVVIGALGGLALDLGLTGVGL